MPAKANAILLSIGIKIRHAREKCGMSKEQFALESGLARSYYSGIERGRQNVAVLNLVKIAQALDCEVGDLFPSAAALSKMGDPYPPK